MVGAQTGLGDAQRPLLQRQCAARPVQVAVGASYSWVPQRDGDFRMAVWKPRTRSPIVYHPAPLVHRMVTAAWATIGPWLLNVALG